MLGYRLGLYREDADFEGGEGKGDVQGQNVQSTCDR